MSDDQPPDRLNQLLDRLEKIVDENRAFFEWAAKRQRERPKPRKESAEESTQPTFWWSGALAPHPFFKRRSEDLCQRIEFRASSIHKFAHFARVRLRLPERTAGIFLSVQITDCPLAGTHCDGDPERCLLGASGRYRKIVWKENRRGFTIDLN